MLVAASLELKAEKQSAHSDIVSSVTFSPDGKTIVSGSWDKTIKVWDAGASALTPPILSPKLTTPVLATASLELKTEKQIAHSDWVFSVAFSPDSKTIVSGSYDTIKVWDAGAWYASPVSSSQDSSLKVWRQSNDAHRKNKRKLDPTDDEDD